MIRITDEIELDEVELKFDFVRSGGPGGQKVNKTSSAVLLRFDVADSPSLPEDVRERPLSIAGNRISADGVMYIAARDGNLYAFDTGLKYTCLDDLFAQVGANELIENLSTASLPAGNHTSIWDTDPALPDGCFLIVPDVHGERAVRRAVLFTVDSLFPPVR